MASVRLLTLDLRLLLLTSYLLPSAFCFAASPLGTAFTYQGRLNDGGQPASGSYDLRFALYAAPQGGLPLGGPGPGSGVVTNVATPVAHGLFTVTLDFGAGVFAGDARWLEIGVRTNRSLAAFTVLSPRQPLTPSPYALYAPNAGAAATMPAAGLTGALSPANIAPGTITAPMLASNAVSHLSAPDGLPANALGVDANGLVGIGATTPGAGLHISTGREIIHPTFLAELVDGQSPWSNLAANCGVALSSNLLAVAAYGDDAVTLVSISNPAAPALLWTARDGSGAYTNLNGAIGVAFGGSLLAVASILDDAVTLLEVANPAAPLWRSVMRDGVGGFNDLNGPSALDLTSNLLAVAASSDNAVSLINVQTPASPVLLGVMKDGFNGFNDLAGANALARQGTLLAITGPGDNAVTLADIRTPSAPSLVSTIRHGTGPFTNLSGPSALAWSGNLLAINAYFDNAITLVDVRNPASPVWLATLKDGQGGFDHLAGWCGLLFQGNTLWIASDVDSALTAVDVSVPTAPVLKAVLRNGQAGFNHLEQVRLLASSGAVVAAGALGAVTLLDGTTSSQVGLLSDGWVGIGTSLPAAPLHVRGDVLVEGGGVSADTLSADSVQVAALSAGSVQASSVSAGSFQGDGSLLTNLSAAHIVGSIQASNIAGLFAWNQVTGVSRQAAPNQGYVANNAARVTITLPPAPAFGDVVRVTGAGAGGWQIAQNAGQFVSIENLMAFDSAWTAHEFDRHWYAIASSADGTRLVAVDNDAAASGGRIYVSGDAGVTWVPGTSHYHYTGVASSADGSKLVAVVEGGLIYTSSDYGVNWLPRSISMGWTDVASSADGVKLVAVASWGIWTSTDSGLNWTRRTTNNPYLPMCVASSDNGVKLVAGIRAGQLYTSTDSGISWTPRDASRAWEDVASSADGVKLVAAAYGGQLYTSTSSGVSWAAREENRRWVSVASSADGSRLAAVVEGGRIYTSTDSGVTWTPRESDRNWRSVASSTDGTKLAAIVMDGRIYTATSTTRVGTVGGLRAGREAAIELLYVGNGEWRVLSSAGGISSL